MTALTPEELSKRFEDAAPQVAKDLVAAKYTIEEGRTPVEIIQEAQRRLWLRSGLAPETADVIDSSLSGDVFARVNPEVDHNTPMTVTVQKVADAICQML